MSTWVLLRGLMREARHWGDFPGQFKQAVSASQVVTFDFPGNGRMYTQASPATVKEMAQHCRTYLEKQGLSPPYHVLALSLGAMVAIEWSKLHPEEFERLVLINTSLSPINPFYHRLRPGNYPTLIRFLLFGSIRQREALILRLTSTTQRSTLQQSTLLNQWETYARECPVSRANILRQLFAAISYRATQTALPIPTLMLAGNQDRLVNVKCSVALAERWGCPIRLHPTAGHDLPLDDGEWVGKQVRLWLVDLADKPKINRQ